MLWVVLGLGLGLGLVVAPLSAVCCVGFVTFRGRKKFPSAENIFQFVNVWSSFRKAPMMYVWGT